MIEKKALAIAKKAHKGQKDKAGVDYIEHPVAVASYCDIIAVRVAALLHDVVEDSDITPEDLRGAGMNNNVIRAVECLTKKKDENIDEYYKRVAADDIAAAVKFADMRHNSDKSRWPADMQEKAEENYQKYHGRAKRLFDMIGEKRAKDLMTAATYKWLTGKRKRGG